MLEKYFEKFRNNIIGNEEPFETPFGTKKILYADWTASGRLYKKIEQHMCDHIYPFVGNTHTETNVTGSSMTIAYHRALKYIKKHVNAGPEDVIISSNSGTTGVINKFQRILGLKIHETHKKYLHMKEEEKPVVFITHMEHHSNQTSWLETVGDVAIINATEDGLPDLEHFAELLEKFKSRKIKYAAVTSCSNVTGVFTPYYKMAEMIHKAGGKIFVDFACSAPYVDINMHPGDKNQSIDAIYFSPHKFLGGPGTAGVLIFNRVLYKNTIPDNPGGGTVAWTNPWGQHKYVEDIEAREDGGTPSFLQTIRTAYCIKLKEDMGVNNILKREEELLEIIWDRLLNISGVHVLADNIKDRLGVISFYIDHLHYNLVVKLLNDKFGIQVRGGCSCAGTYGHYLLQVQPNYSNRITRLIDDGDLSAKPGWIRMSIHPTMTNDEAKYLLDSIESVSKHGAEWAKDYEHDPTTNEFTCVENDCNGFIHNKVDKWFSLDMA